MLNRFLILLLLISVCGSGSAEPRQNIFVSIPPLQFLMERIVGEDATVMSLVPQNNSPELFEPTPKQIIEIKKADLYFSLGLPFEKKWIEVLSESDDLVVSVACCLDLKTLNNSEDHNHHHKADPHVWTDPVLLIEIAHRMVSQLNKIYPQESEKFKHELIQLEKELTDLDKSINNKLKPFKQRPFIVTHPAWSYYAKRYGLEQIALEQEGKEVGIKTRKKIYEQAITNNIKHIFSVEQLESRSAKTFADELNAEIIFIDPVAYDHIANLQLITNKLIQSFK